MLGEEIGTDRSFHIHYSEQFNPQNCHGKVHE